MVKVQRSHSRFLSNLRNWGCEVKILFKLLIPFLFISILVSVVGLFGIDTALSISTKYDEVGEETLPVIKNLEDMRFLGLSIVTSTYKYYSLTSINETSRLIDVERSNLKAEIEGYDISFNNYEILVNKFFPGEKEVLEEIRASAENLKRISHELIDMKEKGASRDQVLEKFEEFEEVEQDFLNDVDKAIEKEYEEFNEKNEDLLSIIADSGKKISIISFSTIFLGLVVGLIVARSISQPIDKLKNAAEEINKGNLDTRVDIRSDDEIGVFASTFNKMVCDLSEKITENIRTLESLEKKNAFVDTVLESLSYPFYVINVNDYTIALANSAACKKDFAQGSTCYALTHKTDKPCGTDGHICPLEEVKRTKKPVVVEHLHYDKDANVRNMEVHCYPIFDLSGNVVQVIEYSLDITERKRSEEELAESEAKFRTLFDNATDGIMMADIETKKLYMANKMMSRMLGYSLEEIKNINVSDIHPVKDLPWIIEVFEKQARGEITLAENIPVKRKDGTIFYVDINSNQVNIAGKPYNIGIFRDITERLHSQKVLKESEERFRSVAQSASDVIITSDSKGNIIFWNNAAQKMFGYLPEEVQGKPLTILMPQRYREAHLRGIERLNATGKYSVIGKTVELHALRKDGSEIPIELSLSTWKTGEQIYYSGIMRDISERKRDEQTILENERLQLANKTKNGFMAVMSHELRTPLNAIIGFSELLKKKDAGELNEKQQRYVENVNLSGKHLLNVIDDILDLSSVESGKMEIIIEKMSVPDAVNTTVDAIKETASSRNIIIKKQLDNDIEFIVTDPRKFRQVLNNLLDNAVKFSKPEGGTVTITAEKEGEMGKFSISDTGIGIKDEDIGRIFQSFEQLDTGMARKYGGTGLGLVITKKLVEILGGRITAESKYGEGSNFTFYLPFVSEKTER